MAERRRAGPVAAGVLLLALPGLASCLVCGAEEVRDGNRCVPTCNSDEDCTSLQHCQAGRCVDGAGSGSASSSSSQGAGTSSSAAGSRAGSSSSLESSSAPAASSAASSGVASTSAAGTSSSGPSSSAAAASSSGVDSSSSAAGASSRSADVPDAGPSNTAPVLADVTLRTYAERALSVDVPAHDAEADPLSFRVATPAAHGSCEPTASGVRYQPELLFQGEDLCTVVASDGVLESAPAAVHVQVVTRPDCQGVLMDGFSQGSGVYLLDPDGLDSTAAYRATCDMDREGGGWTLAVKVDPGDLEFRYVGSHWTAEETWNPDSPSLERRGAVLASYRAVPADAVLLSMSAADGGVLPEQALVVPAHAVNLAALITGPTTPVDLGRKSWLSLVPDATADSACNRAAFSNNPSTGGYVRTRLGMVFSASALNCSAPTGLVGVGNGMAACNLTGTPSAGAINCSKNPPLVIPMFAALYVRSQDFTALPAQSSCADHLAAGHTQDGRYTVELSGGGDPVTVTCLMQREGGGWTQVADVDPRRDSSCPPGWYRGDNPVTCRRLPGSGDWGRSTAWFPVGKQYQEVLGYVRAYQFANTEAFGGNQQDGGVDGVYADGLSLTVGSPRQHVWTWTASQTDDAVAQFLPCPCRGGHPAPSFVGSSYFCEAGTTGTGDASHWLTDDPLFDGDGQGSDCESPGDPSWFHAVLAAPTQDPLEARLQSSGAPSGEDLGIFRLELYVR